jgi:uncharacterized protein (DUF1499 family)
LPTHSRPNPLGRAAEREYLEIRSNCFEVPGVVTGIQKPNPVGRPWHQRIAGPAILLGLLALGALAAAPLGWRAGWWQLGFSLELMALAVLLSLLGAALAAIALFFARGTRGLWQRLLLIGVLLLGAGFIAAPARLWLRHAPAIHDITTDTQNPPAIMAARAARAAEHAAPEDYAGPALSDLQKRAYPDIAPLLLPLPPLQAFERALATARAMPRWTILASDPASGRIEASATSFWFGFVDDVVIRVSRANEGSRVDMRSLSRQGKGDLGVNAARIRAYMAALRQAAE